MAGLANKWAGRIYGTNTGNLFIELQQDGENLTGIIRLMDNLYGLAIYDFTGTYRDRVELHCIPQATSRELILGEVTVEAVLTPEGNLRGTWHSNIGTAGTFDAYPHDIRLDAQSNTEARDIPEQIYNKNIPIGSIRFFSQDVKRLITFIENDFRNVRAIVTYNVRGSQVTKFADAFLQEVESLGEIKYLKISIQEPEAHGINRVVVIEFSESDTSEIRVAGINEAWVVGRAESLAQAIKPKQNRLVTTYKKYGLNLNTLIFFAMLIAIPSIKSWIDRGIFVVIVFILLSILLGIHRKFIPNTIIYLTSKTPSLLSRAWPSILLWLVGASSTLFAAWIFRLLTRGN